MTTLSTTQTNTLDYIGTIETVTIGTSDAGWPCRWTSGDAMLPVLGAGVLEVELSMAMLYPAARVAPSVAVQPERAAA
jgi:hypothetical protein